MNRLDELEVKASKFDQLELQVSSQQIEINQLKEKLESFISTNPKDDDVSSKSAVIAANTIKGSIRDFLPRSCYELKATNPSAQSGLYFIDPDGQINGDDPVQAYCDMDTSILINIVHRYLFIYLNY